MRIQEFKGNLQKRSRHSGLKFSLGPSSSDDRIKDIENELKVTFPGQVAMFYRQHNGLHVEIPTIEILPLERICRDKYGNIHFALVDGNSISFDTTKLNEAAQWDIINTDSKEIVTKTMASFWSNKVFGYIDKSRKTMNGLGHR